MTPFADPILAALVDTLERAKTAFFVIREQGGTMAWVYASRAYATMVGRTVEEVLAQPFMDRIVDNQRAAMGQLVRAFVTGAEIPSMIEFKLAQPSGDPLQVEALLVRKQTDTGAIGVMLARDPTTPSATPQLNLLEADRISLVGALAAGFAHEINNPLTSVLLNLRSLRKQLIAHHPEANQAQALRCVEDITVGAERIASNVRAFQTLATRGATTRIDLASVVTSALRLAAPTLEARAHVIKRILPVPIIMGEESRIGQAVLAMLLYAISGFDDLSQRLAMPDHKIVVVVEERDRSVVVEVSDNGREPPADELAHAFDPFFRSSARGTGVGVGLGVARSVATTLGGSVTLALAGGGVVTTMRLPAGA